MEDSKELKDAFGEKVIESYLKLKNKQIEDFSKEETFNKKNPITDWEKLNTLDC